MVDPIDYEILPDDHAEYDVSFKLIVIGDSSVGKSCLTLKATKNTFESDYAATVGFEFFTFNLRIKDVVIKLQIWDTCGQEIYRSLITNFYRNSSLAIIVYSINNTESFNNIDYWLKDLKLNASPDAKVFLIGNKVDLEDQRTVETETARKFKEDNKIDLFLETSAKTGFNARQVFVDAAKHLYKDFQVYQKKNSRSSSFSSNSSKGNKSFEQNKMEKVKSDMKGNQLKSTNKIDVVNKRSESNCKC